MKFSICFEAQMVDTSPESEQRTFYEAVEQTEYAEKMGFDGVWAVEHHFLEEYSHCSAPEVFLAAAAAQTKNIRIGHGAVVCVPEMNHPIRVAERAAALDIISGGRLEFGTARSSTWTELGGFEVNPDETKKTWDEFVHVLPKMWTQEQFSYQGLSFSMPERAILPKPLQKPHPPMWVTVTSPGTEVDAAERGLGCLGVAATGFAEQERRTKAYHKIIKDCEPVGEVVNDQVGTLNFLYCHEDPDIAANRGLRFQARQAHGEQRIIREDRADADKNGIALRAQEMHPRLRSFSCDGNRPVSCGRDLVIRGYGKFQNDEWTPRANAQEMPGVIACRFILAETDTYFDSGSAQPRMALPADLGIWIFDGGNHPRDARGDDGIRAGRRLAKMRAWLQRYIERRPPCCFACAPQRLRLRMRPPARLGPAAPDNDVILDDDRADGGIGPCTALPAPAERERELHITKIFGHGMSVIRHSDERNGLTVRAPRKNHLRRTTGRGGSSSPVSSPSTASKSLASRKLR